MKIKNREGLGEAWMIRWERCARNFAEIWRCFGKEIEIAICDGIELDGSEFKAIEGSDSRGLAVHLLSATQGVSLLAHTFGDSAIITNRRLRG